MIWLMGVLADAGVCPFYHVTDFHRYMLIEWGALSVALMVAGSTRMYIDLLDKLDSLEGFDEIQTACDYVPDVRSGGFCPVAAS